MSLRLLLPNQLNFRFKRPESSSRTKKEMQPTLHLFWQRVKDSNPHIQSQSLLCYPYTNPLSLAHSQVQVILY